jgi:radical SAM superfamily enzyme YgiQ (UPF0313 family)
MVNPQVVTSRWGSGLKPRTMEDALPRAGLTHLSAALKRAGHNVELLDLRLLSGWDEYEQKLCRIRPDFVCVTSHTIEIEVALKCFDSAKRILPNCITVGGGIHLSMDPELAISQGHTDYVVRGEGEISLVRLVNNHSEFPPVFWGEPPDLDELPFEDRDLYPDYHQRINFPLWDLRTPIVDLLTSRGCPWSCRFCCGPGEKNLYTKASPTKPERRLPYIRRRSVDHVMAELGDLKKKYDFRGLIFHDDQFLIRPDWVMDFSSRMIEQGYTAHEVRWWAASRADMICRYPEAVSAMRKAGLKIISIGFESFSDEILSWIKKGVDCKMNLRASEICNKLGLDIYANVIFGVPRADGRWYLEDDLASLEALQIVRPKYFSPSFLSPIPGSWFFDWATEQGLICNDSNLNTGTRSIGKRPLKGVDYSQLEALLWRYQWGSQDSWYRRMKLLKSRCSRLLRG